MCGKKYKLDGGQNAPSFSHYSHSNKTPVGSFPRDPTYSWLVLHTAHCWGNQGFTNSQPAKKAWKSDTATQAKWPYHDKKHLHKTRNRIEDVLQTIPDQVLYARVKGLCDLALDFDIWGGYPGLVAASRLRNVWPQGFQDSCHSLQQTCCQALKDLFVHAASIDGLVLIRNIKLQKNKNIQKIAHRAINKTSMTTFF